jgi:ubiquinone/menaquinone biosynthesis C-methylase UbiE
VADLRNAVSGGHYAQKQILSRDKLVAWSHARRFATGLTIARDFAGKRILDFGSGDGTFLALAMMAEAPPAVAVGAELLDSVIEDCRARYAAEPRMSFVQVAALDAPDHAQRYDAVFCMEVLEHVFDWEPELARMARLLKPGGTLVVSVPVETGIPVIVKQVVRTIAGWRKIGHYPGTTSYSWRELGSAVFAGKKQHVTRPVFDLGSGPCHDHFGFNWRVLRDRLSRQFDVTRVVASPFAWLGPGLATQVWFIARLPAGAAQAAEEGLREPTSGHDFSARYGGAGSR